MSNISITNPGGGDSVDAIEFIQGNDGINVPSNPTTHVLFLTGDNAQGVDLSGVAGTYTETITVFDSTTAQKGVVLLASNAETIAGANTSKATTPDDIKAKLGAQTLHGIPYGNAQTGAVQWLAEAADGQIPIGDTGGVPVLANITSTDGSVTVTNGPGSIDLSSQAGILRATGTLTSSQIKNLVASPIAVVPAPGAGKVLNLISCSSKLNYGGTTPFIDSSFGGIYLYYGSLVAAAVSNFVSSVQLEATQDQFTKITPSGVVGDFSLYENIPFNAFNSSGVNISGNVANDNTITYDILYQIVDI